MALLACAWAHGSEPPAFDFATATVAELNAALAAGTITSEQLVRAALSRIGRFDSARTGSDEDLNAFIALNAQALAEARALDAERRGRGPRSPLHGIPIAIKDNIDAAGMPTTGGAFVLAGSMPSRDAEVVRRLRAAGAIILGKTNLSELASGPPMSSIGGPMRNPHDRSRSPAGSSGGSAIAVAAGFAVVALGTDTGGSVRGPAAANGIVGLKPTYGLTSLEGVIPLARSLDAVGPLARCVADIAAVLDVIAAKSPRTRSGVTSSRGRDGAYTQLLREDALAGARLGVAVDYLGEDPEIRAGFAASMSSLEAAGAITVEIRFPDWFRAANVSWQLALMAEEFKPQITQFLATLDPGYPHTLDELRTRSLALASKSPEGYWPNPTRWQPPYLMMPSAPLNYQDSVLRRHAMPLTRAMIEEAMRAAAVTAIVFPSLQRLPPRLAGESGGLEGYRGPAFLANLSGFPELSVPATFGASGLPISVSFLGPAWSDGQLLAYGHALERRTRAYRLPRTTPAGMSTDDGTPDATAKLPGDRPALPR